MVSLKSHIVLKLLDFFFLHEDEDFYVNELVRRLGLDKRNLIRKLKELEKEGFFKVTVRGNMRFYSLDNNFPLYKEYKKIVLKTQGFERSVKEALQKISGVRKAIIFGSYASEKMDAVSDIDILIVGEHKVIDIQKIIVEIQKKYDRVINITDMSIKEFESKRDDPFIKDIMNKEKIELI